VLILKLLKNLIKILNSDANPLQIAFGFAFGACIGLSPLLTPQSIVIWLCIFLVSVNISSAIFGAAIFGIMGLALAPLADKIGYWALAGIPALQPAWTALMNMPIAPFTQFNNTIVMGNIIIAVAVFLPVVLLMKKFVLYYRGTLKITLEQIKFFKMLKASKVFGWYQSLRGE
jgi:uncharacterized protein (TIGR03546 family)